MVGNLFVVATPIGNLEDITIRAVRILQEVDLIAAEDTRYSRRLLDHLGISTPMTSYHEHNEETKSSLLVEALSAGQSIALITDAGTPCISDPGYRLVRAAREQNIPVVSIPGPSAAIAALSISGMPSDRFAFHGFFPRKRNQAIQVLAGIAKTQGTHIFYESPNRMVNTLKLLAERIPAVVAAVARELTKIHEEFVSGTPAELVSRFSSSEPRGECVLLLYVETNENETLISSEELGKAVEDLMSRKKMSRKDAIRQVSEELGVPRNAVYAAATERKP